MAEQILFAREFIDGMAPGMLGGAYAGQLNVGHGDWNNGAPTINEVLTDDPAVAKASLNTGNYPVLVQVPVLMMQLL